MKKNPTNILSNIITTVSFLCEKINFLKKTTPEIKAVNRKPNIAGIAELKINPDPGSIYPAKNIFSPSSGTPLI